MLSKEWIQKIANKNEEVIMADGSDIVYVVDKENNIVRAFIQPYTLENAIISVCNKKHIGLDDHIYSVMRQQGDVLYSGKAICSKDDEFDLEVGKKIARERLLERYYIKRLDYLRMISESIDHTLQYFEDQMNYAWLNAGKYQKDNVQIEKENAEELKD